MKTLNITFDDKEYEYLSKIKEESEIKSWHDFILHVTKIAVKVNGI